MTKQAWEEIGVKSKNRSERRKQEWVKERKEIYFDRNCFVTMDSECLAVIFRNPGFCHISPYNDSFDGSLYCVSHHG